MIKYNYNNINDWNLGDSNLIKVYRHNAICYYKVVAGETAQTPCYAVVDDITQYQDTEFENVFNKADNKWYKLNNLNEYEEYGVYGSGRTECSGGTPTDCVTTYEGKLTIDGDYEYQYSGNSWNNVGEISGSSRLPQGYTEVEYIQNYSSTSDSTSTLAYINTNFTPTQNTRTVADIKIDKDTTNPRLFGNGRWNSLGYIVNCEETVGSNGKLYYKFGQTSSWYQTSISVDMQRHVYDFNNNGQFILDNTSIATLPSTSFTCVYPMGIFTATREENDLVDLNETIYGTLYSCQIYDNGTLVRDFVPCINPSNVVGVYDVVNDVFYGSANNNNFVAGSAVTPSSTVYPVYYDEIQDPPTQVSFSSMTEAEQYECPYVGLMATINGDLYIFNDNYEWEAIPFTLSGTTSSPSAFTLTINDTSVPTRILSDNGDGTYNWVANYTSAITVAQSMCRGNSALTSFDWGTSDTSRLTVITSAFSGCTSLSSVTIPNSVESIGESAFSNCKSLTSIDIPSGVTQISQSAFQYCTSLTSCTIGSGVTSIGNSAFYYCTGLTSCTIGSGVTSIGNSAFYNCTSLRSIDIPNSVTSILYGAFYNCTSLRSCTIGSGVTSIGNSAFYYCTSLKRLNSNVDGMFNIPSGVTSIGSGTFDNCTSLTSVTIPSGVTQIYGGAFSKCTSLRSIDIPNSVTSILYGAFDNCTSLRSCTIGSGVTEIGAYAFRYCTSLTSITVLATTPPTLGSTTFDNTNNCPIYVPAESVETYKTAWSDYASRIQAIPSPSTHKFQATYSDSSSYSEECDSNTELTSASTKPSGYVASAMTTAVVGDCITSLGTDAFRDCSGLTSITLPSGLTSIGENSIRSCTSLSSITIPDSVTTIGNASFRYCTGLTSVNIPSGVTSINQETFKTCRSLTNITIPNSVTSIGNNAFEQCSSLTSINIPSGVTTISSAMCKDCSGLTSVNIPSGVTSISNSAFRNCNHLTNIDIPNSVTSIDNNAFSGCSRLTSIEIPDSVTSIGSTAFHKCSGLTSCTIGSGVTTIGNASFQNCTGLTSIIVNATMPPTIASNTFGGTNCPIYVPSESVETYKAASGWSFYASRIQAIP